MPPSTFDVNWFNSESTDSQLNAEHWFARIVDRSIVLSSLLLFRQLPRPVYLLIAVSSAVPSFRRSVIPSFRLLLGCPGTSAQKGYLVPLMDHGLYDWSLHWKYDLLVSTSCSKQSKAKTCNGRMHVPLCPACASMPSLCKRKIRSAKVFSHQYSHRSHDISSKYKLALQFLISA